MTTDSLLSDAEFESISALVYKHCGINLHDGKKELVRARLAKRLRLCGFDSVKAYMAHVQADATGKEFTQLIDAMSTNLTSFFREISHFNYLTEHHLPALIERKQKKNDNRIRVWSAGCSTGEEPYTLAVTLLNQLEGKGTWDIKILATDISTRVLQHAAAGVYDAKRVESVPAGMKQKYFVTNKIAGNVAWQVQPAVQKLITFRYLNLMEAWPFKGPFDFIFCRNVMIYFDKPTQEKLVNRYAACLDAGGLLFTGHSESLTGIKHPFHYVQPTIYGKP